MSNVGLNDAAAELDAMRAVHAALQPLTREARARVLRWVQQALPSGTTRSAEAILRGLLPRRVFCGSHLVPHSPHAWQDNPSDDKDLALCPGFGDAP